MTEMWYNLSAIDATTPLSYTLSIHEIFMNYELGTWVLIAIFTISYIGYTEYNNNPRVNFMFSSFIVAFFSILLRILNLSNDRNIFICIALFAVSLAIFKLFDDE